MNVEWLGGFIPVITAYTRDGEFDAIGGMHVAADLALALICDYADRIVLMLIAVAPSGANCDGIVDVADLGVLGANWTALQTTGNASALVPEPTL